MNWKLLEVRACESNGWIEQALDMGHGLWATSIEINIRNWMLKQFIGSELEMKNEQEKAERWTDW